MTKSILTDSNVKQGITEMRHSRRYYAQRAYRQRQYNKSYNAKMQARERAAAAAKARRIAQKVAWRSWHVEHPGERWAPGEKQDLLVRLTVGGIILGIVVLFVIFGSLNRSNASDNTPTYTTPVCTYIDASGVTQSC
jgi:hypothetical protein